MAVELTLRNGQTVRVNDHVYSSPSWSTRDGTPYSIARIMEFLPPEDSAAGKGKGKETFTRVRLAWYYRPSDVSDRAVADSRLLLAAIYSEISDVAQIRGKCFVMHKDKLSDLSGWKKKPDHFYFCRLFDPYIKKEFEVLLATDIRNLPAHIKEVLVSRYEYVVAEKEVVPDLTDALRLCRTCEEWCPNNDAVQCDSCKYYFHMGCVTPPLLSKPSRGYGWTCAPCSRRHEDQVDSGAVRSNTPLMTRPGRPSAPVRGRGRPRKDKSLDPNVDENTAVKHYKMWPFRYFGLYTVAEDALDPDDLIFPRAATRVGQKYQASLLPEPSGSSIPGIGINPDIEERGDVATIEVYSNVASMSDAEVDLLEKLKSALTNRADLRQSVDWLTEIIFRYSDAYQRGADLRTVNLKNPLRQRKWKKLSTRYTDREWNDDEITAFEDGIAQFGAELRSVKGEVGTRTMPEVVRYYGRWKNSKLREENERKRAATEALARLDLTASTTTPAATKADDDGSVVDAPTKPNAFCAACRTHESSTWWKAPKSLPSKVFCNNCGLNYRKYADLSARPVREDPSMAVKSRNADKREGTPLVGSHAKKTKTNATASTNSTPPPAGAPAAPAATQILCLSCYKHGPVGKVLKCKQCGFHIHAGACGAVVEAAEAAEWVCELCNNDKTLEASLDHNCLLCPRPRPGTMKSHFVPPADTYLRACKPTEGQGWVHVLCAVFIPEITFADTTRLRLVEGISTVHTAKWISTCTLCGESGGAVIRCGNCPKEYHVSCAWRFGHRFGFDIQPVKSTRRDFTPMVTFKGETGSMTAVICCKEHASYRRDLYDICDTDDNGDTALQVFCRVYKQVEATNLHGLLRKARRLDQLLNLPPEETPSLSVPNEEKPNQCYRCHTQYSPIFYKQTEKMDPTINGPLWLCHRCHFESMNLTNGMIS